MIELMGHPLPESNVIGVVPERITFRMGLSDVIEAQFEPYIAAILAYLQMCGIDVVKRETQQTLLEIIDIFKYPTH
jgi:hypothetical protein